MNVWEMSSLFHESNMLDLLSFMLIFFKDVEVHFNPGTVKMCNAQAERGVSSSLRMWVMS